LTLRNFIEFYIKIAFFPIICLYILFLFIFSHFFFLGWDIGMATMKRGERSVFTIEHEYAYGENG
jgi:hypothetical protein